MSVRKLLKCKGNLVEILLKKDTYIRYGTNGKIQLWFYPMGSISFLGLINRLIGVLINVEDDDIIINSLDHEDEHNRALEVRIPKTQVRLINVFSQPTDSLDI